MNSDAGKECCLSGDTIKKEHVQPSVTARESSQDTIIIEPQEIENTAPPNPAPIPARPRFSTFQSVHTGWDASDVSTAKCDLCHRQRCGTIQRCSECKLSICKECSLAGRLQSDERHTLDHDSVSWDTPPSSRRRKSVRARDSGQVAARRSRGSRRAVGRGRGGVQIAVEALRSGLATSTIVSSPVAASPSVGNIEAPANSPNIVIQEHNPVEPRYSVAPTSYYSYPGPSRQSNIYRPPPLPYSPQTRGGSFLARVNVVEPGRSPHSRLLPPIVPRGYTREATNLPPLIRPFAHITGRTFPPPERQPTDRAPPSTSEDPPLHTRNQRPLDPPVSDREWPSSSTIHPLGTQLANSAQALHATTPNLPLDVCLRDEVQRIWTSPAFIHAEPDPEYAFRLILAATYFASVHLGFPSRQNAAREWLCEQERNLCAMGYEPIKSNPLTSFLCDVGVQYLKRG